MRMKKSSLIVVTISLSSSRGFGFAHGLLTRVATRPNGWANEMHSYFGGFTALANEFLTDLRGILKFKNTNLSPIAQAAKSLLLHFAFPFWLRPSEIGSVWGLR